MTENKKLFTPIDGVIVKIEKATNTAGIEMPDSLKKKNEGVVVSKKLHVTDINEYPAGIIGDLTQGKKIKFTEGYELEDNLLFVKLDKIIGIY